VTLWKEEGVVGSVVAACGCSVFWVGLGTRDGFPQEGNCTAQMWLLFSKHSKKEEGELVMIMGLFMLLEVDFLEWEEWSTGCTGGRTDGACLGDQLTCWQARHRVARCKGDPSVPSTLPLVPQRLREITNLEMLLTR
jgi:hypothetical protein